MQQTRSRKLKMIKQKKIKKIKNDAMDLASIVFEDSKAISAGIAFINTAEGVTAALAKADYAGAAVIYASGAAQISSILSASKGVNSGGTSVSSAPSSSQSIADEDTASLDFTDSTAQGSGSQVITFAA